MTSSRLCQHSPYTNDNKLSLRHGDCGHSPLRFPFPWPKPYPVPVPIPIPIPVENSK